MRRREFISLIGGVAIAWPLATRAQQTTIPVIGFLSLGSPDSDPVRVAALRRGLNEAGYVEGQTVTIEYRWAGNQLDRLPTLAADLVQHGVAVIVTPGPASTLAAKAATATVPIAFAVGNDPVELGLVASLSRPGGNLTGSSAWGREVSAKGIEVLHELLPAAASVGFLANPGNHLHAELQTRAVLTAGRTIGVEIQILHASTQAEIDAAFAKLTQARTGALLVSVDYFLNSQVTQLVALAARYAVPTLHTLREFPVAGGLMSYGGSLTDIYRLTGLQVARILKGEKPADLPVVQSTMLELVINLKAAKALGLTVPPTLLARADEVIE
jgi:putative tryptophan/tyrosine transport system substrate-binding protein